MKRLLEVLQKNKGSENIRAVIKSVNEVAVQARSLDFSERCAHSDHIVKYYNLLNGESGYYCYQGFSALGYEVELLKDLGPDYSATLLHPEDQYALSKVIECFDKKECRDYEMTMRIKDVDHHWRLLYCRIVLMRTDDLGAAVQIAVIKSVLPEETSTDHDSVLNDEIIFTKNELLIIRLISHGLTRSQIAERMLITLEEFDAINNKLFKKTGAKSFAEILNIAHSLNYLG